MNYLCNEMTRIMKKLLFFLFAFLPVTLMAQDRIQTIGGQSINAKILEINEDSIIYKDYSNLDGPTYRIGIDNVATIVFQNGIEEVYSYVPDSYILPTRLDAIGGDIYGDGVEIPQESLIYILGPEEYDSYNAGLRFRKTGKTLTFVGLGLTAAGGIFLASALLGARQDVSNKSMAALSGYSLGLGVSCLIASIPFSAVGRGKINAVVDNYNYNRHTSLNIGVTGNGVGFALNF